MTEKMKTTAPVSSVGADGAQPQLKNYNEIIANETAQINLQAAQNPEKSRSGGLQTVSMTELYDTVYPPRTPVVDGFLYGGTYLFVGAPKVGKSFFMGQLAYHVAMGLPLWDYPVRKGTVLYLALEDDKCLYFGHTVDGVLPYGIVGDTIIVNGDPVCKDEDFPALLAEFKNFCQKSAHNIFFLGLTDYYLSEYEKQGFGLVKSGEEARFKLSDYEITGKKGAKMRMNINHATKAGVTVHEYKVLEKRDPAIDKEFDRITNEWLEGKKSGMLQFTMGTVGLENPMDKRYFYALNSDGKMVAFIVFVPFLGKNGYMADVTRHGKDAPGGVMETIIYQAFQVFKEEGIGYGSLGVAPLAGLDTESKNPMERLLRFIYDHLNDCYGYRDLYQAKKKYSPTEWVPSYYAYLPKYPTPSMLYAAVEIQNPHGIRGYIMIILKGELKRLKK